MSEYLNSATIPRELLLQVSQLNLPERMTRRLEKRGIHYLGDLVSLSESDLLDIPRLGRKTVKELKSVLRSLRLSLSMGIPGWARANVAKLAKRHAAELSRLRQAWLRRRFGVDSRSGVKTEVASALAAVLKASDASTIESWIGLDQVASPTLHSLGVATRVTRERIRQIMEMAKRRLAAVQFDMPCLHSAVDGLRRLDLSSHILARTRLFSDGLATSGFSMRGLFRAAELFGLPMLARMKHERVAARFKLVMAKKIRGVARRATTLWGCSTIDKVCAEVSKVGDAPMTAEVVRETLMSQAGFHWLDEEAGWFWLERVHGPGPFSRLQGRIDKILAVAHRLDLHALRAALARNYRMDGFAPPRRVLAIYCGQLEDCRLVGGRTVVDTRPRDPAAELSPTERTMVKVFQNHGPMLSTEEATRLCRAAGLYGDAIRMALSFSPVVQRVAKSVYALVGARVTARAIEAKANATHSRMRFYASAEDYGWRPDASGLWVTYQITEALHLRGVLRAPDAIKRYLDPRGYELRDLRGSRIGHVDITGAHVSGFLPFFRRRGGEPGDHLRVTFNLAKRIALVEVSEQEFDNSGSLR